MTGRKQIILGTAAGLALLWIGTRTFGRAAVTNYIFANEVDRDPAFGFKRPDYVRVSKDTTPPEVFPYYYTETWSPFPFVVVADYGVMWGVAGGGGGRRVYLWFFGSISSSELYNQWA